MLSIQVREGSPSQPEAHAMNRCQQTKPPLPSLSRPPPSPWLLTPRAVSLQPCGRTVTDHRIESNRAMSPEVASPQHAAAAKRGFGVHFLPCATTFGGSGYLPGHHPNGRKADWRMPNRFGLFASAGTMVADSHGERLSEHPEGEGTISRSRCPATRRIRK